MKPDVFELTVANIKQLKSEESCTGRTDPFVYFLFRGNTCLYIGRSYRIYDRLKQHKQILFKNYKIEPTDILRFVRCDSVENAARMEREFIIAYQPLCNRQGAYLWKEQ
jgi:predicted GIY-YIG superfamily endonuclease